MKIYIQYWRFSSVVATYDLYPPVFSHSRRQEELKEQF